jgi:protein disulfide-isomerase-like protein
MVGQTAFLRLSLLLLAVGVPTAAAADESSLVVTLTRDNFKAEVESFQGIVFVEFYAPWCGHCKKLLPELEEAAKQLWGSSPGIKIAKMDADRSENKPVSKRFGVKGFPGLKVRTKLFSASDSLLPPTFMVCIFSARQGAGVGSVC